MDRPVGSLSKRHEDHHRSLCGLKTAQEEATRLHFRSAHGYAREMNNTGQPLRSRPRRKTGLAQAAVSETLHLN